jgi:hypothetical protein
MQNALTGSGTQRTVVLKHCTLEGMLLKFNFIFMRILRAFQTRLTI